MSSTPAQQMWPEFHAYGNYLFRLSGSGVVTANLFGDSQLLLDSIDLVDTTLLEGDNATLSIGAADGSTDVIDLFRGYVYANSQGYFPWRGAVLLSGDNALWISSTVGVWTVHWHGLVIPSYAGQQFDQG